MPLAKLSASPAGTCAGVKSAVLPAVDAHGERARRPALVVDILRAQHLLQEADLIVDIENGEVGLQPDEFGVTAQDSWR